MKRSSGDLLFPRDVKYWGMDTPPGRKQSGFALLVFSISLAIFMSSLDGTIVNIALPTISSSFDISTTTVSWVATVYLIVMAGCVLVFGKISDLIGFKKIFLAGFSIFTAGSLMCGVLPDLLGSFDLLIVSRVVQGVGGAMMTAIAPAMVTEYIPLSQKGRAMGIVMTMAALGMAVGPTIGGLLTEYLSWHWIFFINVPVGIAAVLLGHRAVPRDTRTGSLAGFDYPGAVLLFVGLAAIIFALSDGLSLGWTSPPIVGAIIVGMVSLAGLALHEIRREDPLLEFGLFRERNFLTANIGLALLFFSFGGVNYLLPFYLEYVQGFSSSEAGLILTVLSFAMMVAGLVAGALFNREGGRPLSIVAAGVIILGYFMLTGLRADSGLGYIFATLFCIGFGLGLLVTPLSNMILNAVQKKYQGVVSSLTSVERFAPMPLGIAVFNLALLQGVQAVARHRGVIESSPASIKIEVLSAGFDLAFLAALVVAVIILLVTLVTRLEIHPDYRESDDGEIVLGMA
ncbi:MAG: MFS transporter [Methanomicrobiales archaeon]